MKTLSLILSVVIVLSSASAQAGGNDRHDRNNVRLKNLFVFKTEKKFLGAKVEILSASGEVITSQSLERRKVVIDFADVGLGTYTIRVSKGQETKEFLFVKK